MNEVLLASGEKVGRSACCRKARNESGYLVLIKALLWITLVLAAEKRGRLDHGATPSIHDAPGHC